ncbi:hypothetical protein SEA_SIXAMA_70 [Gordonia phage Sixama]|uniref:Uncharacterized protein n=1 Tax=Gordonia phage Sixama TaxID=2653271 RepID=A0A5Q2F147_9CAUD|nr:hypothetical protein PP302_gp070 [Gordonia phage Sixama]QGF20249.1 hypothetical protein SEA_SIXAMA_70 [Gordonia phage Sixama]
MTKYRVDADPAPCTCNHDMIKHRRDGKCGGKDSYGIPCDCPSYEPDPHWNEFDHDDD